MARQLSFLQRNAKKLNVRNAKLLTSCGGKLCILKSERCWLAHYSCGCVIVRVCVFGRGAAGTHTRGTLPTNVFVKLEEDKHSPGQRSHESK